MDQETQVKYTVTIELLVTQRIKRKIFNSMSELSLNTNYHFRMAITKRDFDPIDSIPSLYSAQGKLLYPNDVA